MGMGSPSRRHGRRRAPMAEINVTPLVDVMLVLLIIFMVTAPLLVAGVPVNLPETQAKALETEQEPVAVTLDAQGRTWLGETAVTEGELTTRLAALGRRTPAPQIFLRADGQLDYARVMRVMGALNAAGLNRVSLVTIQAGEAAR